MVTVLVHDCVLEGMTVAVGSFGAVTVLVKEAEVEDVSRNDSDGVFIVVWLRDFRLD